MISRTLIKSIVFTCILAVAPAVVHAHEYWLDPIDSSVKKGESAIVDIRNGTDFSGAAFPYQENKLAIATVTGMDTQTPYIGRLGDYPALHPEFMENGTYAINVETTTNSLTYESWEKFSDFLIYHGFDEIKRQIEIQNLPKTDIVETYFRSAKTYIQVSDSGELTLSEESNIKLSEHQAFAPTGAKFEMILLDNPYADIDSLQFKLLHNGQPVADRQVELFWKAELPLRMTNRTNESGVATFKLLGPGDYLINAVHLTIPTTDKANWLSRWASITFKR